jgi:carboxyl-terminal processing protease
MKKVLFVISFVCVFVSCKKAILGPEPANDPEVIFETIWNDLDRHYALFTVRNTNWDSLYTVYRPQVNNATTDEQLWEICSNLIENLDDSHTVLFKQNDSAGYVSGHTLNVLSKLGFSKDLITNKYLESRTEVDTEKALSYGKLKNKDIGYIYLGAEDGSNPAIIDEVVSNLKDHKAIILDVRQNKGGDDLYAKRIAAAFADGEHLIYTVQTRTGPGHGDFDSKTEYYTRKATAGQYQKPVIVLTDRRTISSGEVFLLHMKSFQQVTQIGDTTAGDFSNIGNRKFLPNGWSFQYSIQMFLLPDGSSLDGIGHVPSVFIKNTEEDIIAENDKVLEKAMDYLWVTYGID